MSDSDGLRHDVATANRILERLGLSHAFGHASARIPGTNTFMLPTRHSPGLADAEGLLVLDTEGRIVSGDLVALAVGAGIATMMRGHGITTALPDVRSATVAACYLEESAALQLRMLAATAGDASRLRIYFPDEAEALRDQVSGNVGKRAWEYFAAVAEATPIGGGQRARQ